ncbi:hypothetical protein RUND412_011371 [Rhizina undulata]
MNNPAISSSFSIATANKVVENSILTPTCPNVREKCVRKARFALPDEEAEDTNAESLGCLATNTTYTINSQTTTRDTPDQEKWLKLKGVLAAIGP